MPGGFQLGGGQSNFQALNYSTTTTAVNNAITASSSINTKGSYSELVTSLAYDCFGFTLEFTAINQPATGALVDIAIGASGSEVIILSDICYDMGSVFPYNPGTASMYVPIALPAGTRIAGRMQAGVASTTAQIGFHAFDGGFDTQNPLGFATTYGADETKSLGTAIDPGSSANTKGSWVQLTGSSAYAIRALQMMLDSRGGVDTTNGNWFMDIGIGGAGSEQVLIPNVFSFVSANRSMMTLRYPPIMAVSIPAGTRIAARAQSTLTTSAIRQIGLSLIGYS